MPLTKVFICAKPSPRKAMKLGAIEINIENFYVRSNCDTQLANKKDCVFYFKIIVLLIFWTKKIQENKKPIRHRCGLVKCGGEGWIRTTEVTDNRFTVCSLWPLGNLSVWSWWSESNQQPTDYKSVALPVELHQRIELLVPRGGLEPPTQGFSVPCSTTWATEAFGISIPLF